MDNEIIQNIIRGDKEKTDVHLQQPAESNYIIYVDEERYEFVQGEEGSFIITQRYFLEASEGHGVRFDEMLKQFKILD